MLLPISMEDLELFPKNKHLILPSAPIAKFLPNEFDRMHKELSKMWWSRLIISVRGYVVNYVQDDDEKLFLADDAFIIIHRKLVEIGSNVVKQFLADLELIVNFPHIVNVLNDLRNSPKTFNPFEDSKIGTTFARIYGGPNAATYRIASAQIIAHIIFMHIFTKLQQRWISSAKKSKSIRFQEDPEWQPDDRVVLFQHFFEGNRTWVMTDFDRHIFNVWRPKGSMVIFGDRFIEDKKRLGYFLCSYCGMLEQRIGQFSIQQREQKEERYCSQKCFQAAFAAARETC